MIKNSGLPPEMPKAPGNAKAGQPPRRAEAGGALPPWLDSSKAKFTKERLASGDERRRNRAGRFSVGDSQQKPRAPFRALHGRWS
jgi:hypothetical protein